MVFHPKGRGRYRVIGLVEVVWKVYLALANFLIKRSVILHDALHGFSAGRGAGKATLEENLAQQLAGITHEPLLQVFLDVQKAYNSLYRGR